MNSLAFARVEAEVAEKYAHNSRFKFVQRLCLAVKQFMFVMCAQPVRTEYKWFGCRYQYIITYELGQAELK